MDHNQTTLLSRLAEEAMLARGLLPSPPRDALAEVAVPAAPPPQGLTNLSDLPWTSIDNVESRDLDQIEALDRTAEGTRLYVAIADVIHHVPAGSATDRFAAHNTTSVYTGVRTFPMLPVVLSEDRSSLLQDRQRLAVVIETLVHDDGTLGPGRVYRALVKNHAKLDYPAVTAWLDGYAPPPAPLAARPGLREQLEQQNALARRLAAARREAGALDVDTGEVRAVLDDHGSVVDLAPHHPGKSSVLIEELMIASNRTVAQTLDAAGLVSLRRVVREPKRWARIVGYALERGVTLPDQPSCKALSRFVDAMRKSRPLEEFTEISLSLVKLMGRGEYAAHTPGQPDIGHFGLATGQYTHATAPNRRYPDLITQRLLASSLTGSRSPYGAEELVHLADHCTRRESDAQKVERQVHKSVAAMLMSSRIGQRFPAIVTGASPKGTWARVLSPPIEGRVVRGDKGLEVGDRVQVTLLSVSVQRGFIDFEAA